MKIFHLISVVSCLLAILFFTQCKEKGLSQTENVKESGRKEIVENFVTGALRRKFTTVDGLKQDTMFDYYQSGKIRAYKLFKNDLQHGKTTVFHEDGKLKEVQFYDNDLNEGGDTIWHESGKLKMIVNYKKGLKHGQLAIYDTLGTRSQHVIYRNDTLVEVNGKKVDRIKK
jgi:antitoxin component YwqK of YwqJK toxin-antitoxin module